MFLLRPEIGETRFPETYGETIDGAVILGRLIADGGSAGPGEAATTRTNPGADELARVARRHQVPHLHDPDTAVLPHLQAHDDMRASRACRMGAALAVDLPLRAMDLVNDQVAERLVRATLKSQINVTHPAPPYFEFGALDDPWLAASLKSLGIARRQVSARRLAVFVRATRDALVTGAVSAAAARYAAAVPEGALVLLGVSGLHPEESPPEDLAAYLGAVEAFDDAGFDVIADRVDRFGAAAVACGAVGLAGGTRIYRTIPLSPFWANEWSVKIHVKYSVPIRGDRMAQSDALRRQRRGSIPPCPVEHCRALQQPIENAAVRQHHAHLTQLELEEARENGPIWLAQRYEESPIKHVRQLAMAVRLATRLSAEA